MVSSLQDLASVSDVHVGIPERSDGVKDRTVHTSKLLVAMILADPTQ